MIPPSWLRRNYAPVLYLLIGGMVLPSYRFHLCTDTPSYISIAKKYAAGDYLDAINGFWSPLISWLLIPFLKFQIDPLVAFNILGFLSGLVIIILLGKYFIMFEIDQNVANAFLLAAAPLCISVAYGYMTPDFLALPFLLAYIYILISPGYLNKIHNAILCGVFGALAAYAKCYNFYFFVIHFFIIHAIWYYRAIDTYSRKRIFMMLNCGLIPYLFLTIPWIFILFKKYGVLGFNTAAHYNLLYFGFGLSNPIHSGGLFPLPNATAFSAWEDPYLMTSPVLNSVSIENLIHLFENILRNIIASIDTYQAMSWFAVPIILYACLYLLKHRTEICQHKIFVVILSMMIYNAGYLPFLITNRYLYFNMLLLFILAAFFISSHPTKFSLNKKLLLIFIAISFIYFPVRDLYANRYAGKENFLIAEILKKNKIIGNYTADAEYDRTSFLAYFSESHFFGIMAHSKELQQDVEDLSLCNIQYYLCWAEDSCKCPAHNCKEVSINGLTYPRVFKFGD